MQKILNTVIGIPQQNNSGGFFIDNEDVSVFVAVEGTNRHDAHRRFNYIVEPHSSYCSCCGERWYGLDFTGWPAPDNGVTMDNFTDVEDDDEANCVLHLLDGTKKRCRYSDD